MSDLVRERSVDAAAVIAAAYPSLTPSEREAIEQLARTPPLSERYAELDALSTVDPGVWTLPAIEALITRIGQNPGLPFSPDDGGSVTSLLEKCMRHGRYPEFAESLLGALERVLRHSLDAAITDGPVLVARLVRDAPATPSTIQLQRRLRGSLQQVPAAAFTDLFDALWARARHVDGGNELAALVHVALGNELLGAKFVHDQLAGLDPGSRRLIARAVTSWIGSLAPDSVTSELRALVNEVQDA